MTDLRTIENDSIRAFVQSAADEGYLSGRVLDYGCGKQPYRDIVEAAGGEYQGFDMASYPGNVSGEDIGYAALRKTYFVEADEKYAPRWTSALCTQVVQYVPEPKGLLTAIASFLVDHGYLVLTYPTNWPEVEPEDLHRFTKAGMERLLTEAGFTIIRHEVRATLKMTGWGSDPRGWAEGIALGYGVICRA